MTGMEETKPVHSRIGASSYSRWSTKHGGCPGSVKMAEGCPNVESEYAKEGTYAHEVASTLLENYFYMAKKPVPECSKEMMDAVRVYVDFIKKEVLNAVDMPTVKAGHILIEHRFDLSAIHRGLYGTADAVIYFPGQRKLMVVDYKHGAGIAVDVEENLQLQYYGLGALLSTGLPCETVELVIVQPRVESEDGPVKRWSFSCVDIIDFGADLADDAAATEVPDAPLRPGKHCRFCPAAPVKCPAVRDRAQAAAKADFATPALTTGYDPEVLAKNLAMIPAIEAWITKVHEFAYGEAMHGRLPPGFKLVSKRATRKWVASEEQVVKYMEEATKKPKAEFYSTPSLKTPAQMEKLCSKQTGEGLRAMMASVSSGYNLVPESDSRPAVTMDPKAQFEKIEGGEDARN